MEQNSEENQFAWDMSVSAINTGKVLRILGLIISWLAVAVGLVTSAFYVVKVKGTVGTIGALSSLLAVVPSFAFGQFISLYGTRGILHGIEVQNQILDLDTAE
jgi:hypothetical protein